jgi:hypothetical protein
VDKQVARSLVGSVPEYFERQDAIKSMHLKHEYASRAAFDTRTGDKFRCFLFSEAETDIKLKAQEIKVFSEEETIQICSRFVNSPG